MKDVEVLTGPPGCGKSHRMREDAINNPGRYIFFLPTIPLIREQVEAFQKDAADWPLHEAHSGTGRGSVQRKIDEAYAAIQASGEDRSVVFTTHDALVMRDLSAFKGWHARIDEAPNAAKSGVIEISESANWFASYFNLRPVGSTGWSSLELKGPPPVWTTIARDKLLKPLVDFIKLASSNGGVFVNATTWTNVEQLEWWSIWTPASLEDFHTIKIAGASYHTSLGAIVSRKWFPNRIRLHNTPIPMSVSAGRTIRIHYFTRAHRPSTAFWDTSEGRRMVKVVCDYLGANVPDLGYWSGNAEVLKLMEWRIAGDRLLPKVAGQNRWRDLTKCAFIYSSGDTLEDAPLMKMFEITADEIRRAREDEDILQFVMRGALRKPGFTGVFDAYLYTEEQAIRLKAHLDASSVGNVELCPITEAGIMDENPRAKVKAAARAAARPAAQPKPQKVLNPKTGRYIHPKSAARNATRAKQPKARRPGRPSKSPP